MENNRNLILAMVLSVAVLLTWQVLVIAPREEARRAALEAAEQAERARNPQPAQPAGTPGATPSTTPGATSAGPGAVPGAVPGSEAATRDAAVARDVRVPLTSGRLSGTINLRGARIDDLSLLGYRETVDPDSDVIDLLRPSGLPDSYFAEFGYVPNAEAGALPGADTLWTAPADARLTPETPLVLTYTNDKGLTFERTIALDENYMFSVSDKVTNASGAPVTLTPYGRVARFGQPQIEGIYVLHEGLIGWTQQEAGESKRLDEIDYDDVAEERTIGRLPTTGGWFGITDKYWATALIPAGEYTATYRFVPGAKPLYQTEYLAAPLTLVAGATGEASSRLFAGAKKVELLDAYEANGVESFGDMIDWGWFPFLTKPLFSLMEWFYGLVGNFGVAILLTTVVVKAVFFPLANKSYKSMANMKRVQPEMQALKERHGDDRQAMQKGMMELYKREKINPAAGCLPILVQIPVFFALYKVLYVTIEMRHAPFFGWIEDLSAPDPTSIFNLFGLLPFDVPLFLLIGVWPIIMGITMFVQMQMNPAPPDPTQAMIFKWMPILFTFMLATFPAGLVIYWAWNNFLSIIQQGVIMKRQGAKIELWDNLKGMFGGKKEAV